MANAQTLFDCTLLPDIIQDQVNEALVDEQYHTASTLITDYLADDSLHTPATLICLALCIVEDARSGPFEQIMPRCDRSLDLLHEARMQGGAAAMIRTSRSRIKRIQKREQELQGFESASPTILDDEVLDHIKRRAYLFADRGGKANYLTSARLWRILYRRTTSTPSSQNPSGAFYIFARTGLEFANGGRFDLAQPYLETIIDMEQPAIGRENWMIDYAYVEMLHHAAAQNNPANFEALWWRAVATLAFFPVSRPSQDAFLAQALAFQLPKVCQHLIQTFDQHRSKRTLSVETKATLARARAYVAKEEGANETI